MEMTMMASGIRLRRPTAGDGSRVWRLLRTAGGLDVNTPYSYIMLCDLFGDNCVLAEAEGEPVGFVSALRLPERDDTLFVWQVAVHPSARGRGLAKAMLRELLGRRTEIRYVEATISPSNGASQALFRSLARERGCVCRVTAGYAAELFPKGQTHEEEERYRVGPL